MTDLGEDVVHPLQLKEFRFQKNNPFPPKLDLKIQIRHVTRKNLDEEGTIEEAVLCLEA